MKPLLVREIRAALRSRWLWGYALALGALATIAVFAGRHSASGLEYQAYGRTTATLTNLCLLLAPLVALTMGGLSISGERDRGTLEHLLAQPLTRNELLLAKYFGLLIALSAATFAAFSPALIVFGVRGGVARLVHALLFPALASLLIAALLAVGMLVSVWSRTATQAQGVAILVWFALVLLYDLLLIGTLAAGALSGTALAWLLVLNPIDSARVLVVLALEPDLYLLGPAGALLVETLSQAGAAVALTTSLILWTVLPLTAALAAFRLRKTPRHREVVVRSLNRSRFGDAPAVAGSAVTREEVQQ